MTRCSKRTHRRGAFTLIELSVVLVVIGLLAGGVLVGRDLVEASQIRATVSQVEQFESAAKTFRLKFDCLAGDCGAATRFLSGTNDGNGDGKIGLKNTWTGIESQLFWQHLAAAGLIPGMFSTVAPGTTYETGVNYPAARFKGGFGVRTLHDYAAGGALPNSGQLFPGDYGNTLFLGDDWSNLTSRVPLLSALKDLEALAIDAKFDDGRPTSGQIMTWSRSSGYGRFCVTTDVAATAAYGTTGLVRCVLLFVAAF